jgi:hypothetical protein
VVTVTGGSNSRVSLAALIAVKAVPSTTTTSGSPSATRYFTISRATASPRLSMSQAAPAKNQHARRHFP